MNKPIVNKFLKRARELESQMTLAFKPVSDTATSDGSVAAKIWAFARNGLLLASVILIPAYVAGYRIVAPPDVFLLRTVKDDIPDADSLPVAELRARAAVGSEAIMGIEDLITAPSQENLTDIRKLNQQTNPLILQGRVAALLSIVRMIGDANPDDKAKLVDRFVTLFSVAQNDNVMDALHVMVDLPSETLAEIVDRRGQGAEELAAMATALLQRGGDMEQLSADVEAQKAELQKQIVTYQLESASLKSQIGRAEAANANIQTQFDHLNALKKECSRPYDAYATCFNRAVGR